MTYPVRNLTTLAFAGILFLLCSSRAQAGFVVPDLDSGFSTESATNSENSGAVSHQQSDEHPPRPTKVDKRANLDALVSQGSSMSGNGPTTSSGPAPAAAHVTATPIATNGDLTAYLLAEAELMVPVPYSDGVFRPPETV